MNRIFAEKRRKAEQAGTHPLDITKWTDALMEAASIALTSVTWEKEMLAALTVGEAIGYSVEHMARSSFLLRAESPRAERAAVPA